MFKLILTCGACPEQYDVYEGDRMVGYIRLRHGHMTVDCPDCGGDLVYTANPKGDGMFEDDERDIYLREAVEAIARWMRDGPAFRDDSPLPEVDYEIDGNPGW